MSVTYWVLRGTKSKLVRSIKVPGKKERAWPGPIFGDGIGYGVLSGAMDAWRGTRKAGHHWLYSDGPYWLARKSDSVRLTWDRMWFDGSYGPARDGDLEAAGCVMRDWKQGADVVVAPSSPLVHQMALGNDEQRWVDDTIAELEKHTDRKIVVRRKWKPSAGVKDRLRNMDVLLASAWAVVTSGSTIGVEAVCRGVPVFTTQPCAASPVGCSDLSRIEDPMMPERDAWARNLAARQFTVGQLTSGEAWRVCADDLEHMEAMA